MEKNSSFAEEMAGIKPLKQDKVHFHRPTSKNKNVESRRKDPSASEFSDNEKNTNRFQFSDEYEPYIDENKTLSFVREGYPSYFAKVLRRGDLAPDLILDLHGSNKQKAQIDIADLIAGCIQQQLPCACIVHGVSGGILKKKVPHYLMQHPDVAAFHQAPLEWGGKGAVVLLVDIGEELSILTESFTASGQAR